MICFLASDSTLRGMKVWKACLAMLESAFTLVFVLPVTTESPRGTGSRTLFANSKQLVGFPANDAVRHSAPAPFHDTAEDLRRERERTVWDSYTGSDFLTSGSVRSSSFCRRSIVYWEPPSNWVLKKFRMKLRAAMWSAFGRNGSSRNGMSSAVVAQYQYNSTHCLGLR